MKWFRKPLILLLGGIGLKFQNCLNKVKKTKIFTIFLKYYCIWKKIKYLTKQNLINFLNTHLFLYKSNLKVNLLFYKILDQKLYNTTFSSNVRVEKFCTWCLFSTFWNIFYLQYFYLFSKCIFFTQMLDSLCITLNDVFLRERVS